jgi:hypothetical protein
MLRLERVPSPFLSSIDRWAPPIRISSLLWTESFPRPTPSWPSIASSFETLPPPARQPSPIKGLGPPLSSSFFYFVKDLSNPMNFSSNTCRSLPSIPFDSGATLVHRSSLLFKSSYFCLAHLPNPFPNLPVHGIAGLDDDQRPLPPEAAPAAPLPHSRTRPSSLTMPSSSPRSAAPYPHLHRHWEATEHRRQPSPVRKLVGTLVYHPEFPLCIQLTIP